MKKSLFFVLLAFCLLLTSCGQAVPDDSESAPVESTSESESEVEIPQNTAVETESEPLPVIPAPSSETEGTSEEASSNWEGAEGYYYREGYEYTLEVIFGGSAANRTYNLVIRDQEENMVLSFYNLDTVSSNDLHTEKDGIDYLFRFNPNDGTPMITVESEKGAADFQGDYYLIQG